MQRDLRYVLEGSALGATVSLTLALGLGAWVYVALPAGLGVQLAWTALRLLRARR